MRTAADQTDARRRTIRLTARGRKLMTASFEILAEIERQLEKTVGAQSLEILRACLLNVAAERTTKHFNGIRIVDAAAAVSSALA